MITAEDLQAAQAAVLDGLKQAVSRGEHLRWQRALHQLVKLEDQARASAPADA